jgi:hypothetical protein
MLISAGLFHPSLRARRRLAALLSATPGVTLRKSCGLRGISRLDPARYQAAVLYYHRSRLSSAALAVLDRYLARGGAILALHSATASFKGQERYFRILGGAFAGHGPVDEIRVRREERTEIGGQPAGPDFRELPASFTLRDELYRHRFYGGVTVHFRGSDGESWDEPVVWSRLYGEGRLVYTAFGHTAAPFGQPTVAAILQRSLEWLLQ